MASANHLTPYEALQEAVKRTGSQSALARLCSVSQTAVWKWLRGSKQLPPEYVLTVEADTGISRHDLRPDIYPVEGLPAGRTVGSGAPIVSCDRGAGLKAAAE